MVKLLLFLLDSLLFIITLFFKFASDWTLLYVKGRILNISLFCPQLCVILLFTLNF